MAYPTRPDQRRAQTHSARSEETFDVHANLSKRELALPLAIGGNRASPAFDLAHAASLHRLNRERTWTIVLLCNPLQCLNNLLVFSFADKILGRLFQSNDSDAGN